MPNTMKVEQGKKEQERLAAVQENLQQKGSEREPLEFDTSKRRGEGITVDGTFYPFNYAVPLKVMIDLGKMKESKEVTPEQENAMMALFEHCVGLPNEVSMYLTAQEKFAIANRYVTTLTDIEAVKQNTPLPEEDGE